MRKIRFWGMILLVSLGISFTLGGCAASVVPASASIPESTSALPVFTPTEMITAAAVSEIDDGAVHVSNMDEFLAAIAPNTEIVMEPGVYNLTQAQNYGRAGGLWYHWESVYDGCELVITDLSGLTIRSRDPASVQLLTQPRYANVIRFDAVSNICISGITAGHTKEQGQCKGGVFLFEGSSEIEIQNCRLFGCGIRGLDVRMCQNVHVVGSDLYECTEGCVSIADSYNVLLESSKFYNCKLWKGVFEVTNSNQVAVINSEIFGNTGIFDDIGSLVYSSCPGIYLGGLDVHDNSFTWVFDCHDYPVTLEKSRFIRQTNTWANRLYPVTPEGSTLTDGVLAEMKMRTVQWQAAEPIPIATVAAPVIADGKVHVNTVNAFLAAIQPDTTIYLEPGNYELSSASDYGTTGGEYYRWENTMDGYELVIQGAKGLVIEGAGRENVTITTSSRSANVLRFDNLYGLILRGFSAYHSGAGDGAGGILQMNFVTNANVESCNFYNGFLGICAMNSSHIYVVGTEISRCSSGAGWFYGCQDARMDTCNTHDNGGSDFFADPRSTDVLVNGQSICLF